MRVDRATTGAASGGRLGLPRRCVSKMPAFAVPWGVPNKAMVLTAPDEPNGTTMSPMQQHITDSLAR